MKIPSLIAASVGTLTLAIGVLAASATVASPGHANHVHVEASIVRLAHVDNPMGYCWGC
jgi:hypothetical protein